MSSQHWLRSLQNDALLIRRRFLQMHFRAHAGHLGSGLSAIDILTYLYKIWLGPDDKFILSKGHGASSLYATLRHFDRISEEEIQTYYKDGTLLPAHPAPRGLAPIVAATGSLGHGLPIAAGMCYAFQYLHGTRQRVACLLSDGDCNEGAVWEAALFAAHHRLDALTVVIDANGLQGFGRTADVLGLEPLADKWRAFGFRCEEVDGHHFPSLHEAMQRPPDGRPLCVLARTIKGKGVSVMEDKLEWHYLPMNETQYAAALKELDDAQAALGSPS